MEYNTRPMTASQRGLWFIVFIAFNGALIYHNVLWEVWAGIGIMCLGAALFLGANAIVLKSVAFIAARYSRSRKSARA